MRKLDWKIVKDIAEVACGFAAYGLILMASNKIADNAIGYCIRAIGYDEAIESITKSGMYSDDKCEAIKTLPRDAGADFYKAIIHIAKDSRLYSSDKVDLIKGLSANSSKAEG